MKESFNSFGKKLILGAGLVLGVTSSGHAQQEDSVTIANENRELRDKIAKEQASVPQATPDEIKKAREFYESERDWMIKTVSSPEYRKRLIEHEKMTEKDADSRISRILNTPLIIQPGKIPYLYHDSVNNSVPDGITIEESDGSRYILLPSSGYKAPAGFGLTVHEETHASTDGDKNISDTAKNYYADVFGYANDVVNIDTLMKMPGVSMSQNRLALDPNAPEETKKAYEQFEYWNWYETDPTELDAHKKTLEYEMDILGIKNYEDEFTQKTLDQLYSMYNQLSSDSRDFLNRIQQDKFPEFIKLMNTIAQNDDVNNVKKQNTKQDVPYPIEFKA